MRAGILALLLVLCAASPGFTEWQVKPFLGLTFGSSTSFAAAAPDDPNVVLGASAMLIGELVGVEADFSYLPGFFGSGGQTVTVGSSVATLTGSVVLALPERLARYSLRPYFVGGAGLVRVRRDDVAQALRVSSTLPAVDLGGGATGFLTDRIGLSWDVRRIRSIRGKARGFSFGPERVSFWRASMALAVRY